MRANQNRNLKFSTGLNRSCACLTSSPYILTYLRTISIDLCPRIRCSENISAPFCTDILAKVWRKVCGEHLTLSMPAMRPYLAILRRTLSRFICSSRSEEHTSELQSRGHLECR